MESMDFLIDKFRNAENPIIYFGAGISTSAPSSIPTFSKLMEAYFDAINETGGNILEKHSGEKAKTIKEIICNLPIEDFFNDIKEIFTKRAFEPLDWMNDRQPNQAHKLLASISNDLNIKAILTPNFDCLLEKELPDFFSIDDMKNFSKKRTVYNINELINIKSKLSTYLDNKTPAIFHLHGTSIKSRIDITPLATKLSFDHFDHANLSLRLKDAVVLFAGSSGNYDLDIIDLLRLCNLKSAIWIKHDSKANSITEVNFPINWKNVFYDKCYAIKGNTTEILAKFAKKIYYNDESASFEFHEKIKDYFIPFDKKWKLYAIAILINKICHKNIAPYYSDIAISILEELENEIIINKTYEEDKLNQDYISAISQSDYVRLTNGRKIKPEQYLKEYNIYNKFNAVNWSIIVGRAKAIAMSRHQNDKYKNKKIEVIKNMVMKRLEEVMPYELIGPEEKRKYPFLIREWMLAYESLGIFYLEDGDIELANENINKAINICSNDEDVYRLSNTKIIIGNELKLSSILNTEEEKKIEKLLDEYRGGQNGRS